MLSSELEIRLNEAFQAAREARHEFMTVEHLLLAIIDTPKVREILRACGADVAKHLADEVVQLGLVDGLGVDGGLPGWRREARRRPRWSIIGR